jgi:hypothetical protein
MCRPSYASASASQSRARYSSFELSHHGTPLKLQSRREVWPPAWKAIWRSASVTMTRKLDTSRTWCLASNRGPVWASLARTSNTALGRSSPRTLTGPTSSSNSTPPEAFGLKRAPYGSISPARYSCHSSSGLCGTLRSSPPRRWRPCATPLATRRTAPGALASRPRSLP